MVTFNVTSYKRNAYLLGYIPLNPDISDEKVFHLVSMILFSTACFPSSSSSDIIYVFFRFLSASFVFSFFFRFSFLDLYNWICSFPVKLSRPVHFKKSGIKIKINLNFYFHTSFWCLKRFYEGL